MSESAPVARHLAELVVGLEWDDLSPSTVEHAKLAVLDQLGIMLTGSTLGWTRPVLRLAELADGTPRCTVVGHDRRLPPIEAGMVNANFGHACEFDDSGYDGSAHAGALTVAPAMALCEADGRGGRDLLLAIVAGYELLYRIGRVMTRSLLDLGFHHQSVLGPFGAVAVSGKLLGLDVDTMTHAISIAASHASGTMEYDQRGGEVKRYHSAMAVRAGMSAAVLASEGLTGPDTIFEGKRGVVPLFTRRPREDAERIADPGPEAGWFAIEGRTVKAFPTAGPIHTSIQAIQRLVDDHGFTAHDVASIEVTVDPYILLHGGTVTHPTDAISAQFSLAYSVALRLVSGANDLRDYLAGSRWEEPPIRDLIDRITIRGAERDGDERPDFRTIQAADVAVTLTDGTRHSTYEQFRKGSTKNPLTLDEQHDKFTRLATAAVSGEQAAAIIAQVDVLDRAATLDVLLATLVP